MQEEESSGERDVGSKEKVGDIDVSNKKDRLLKRVNIWLLKVLPMVISTMYLLHTVLTLTGKDFPPLKYLGGMSLIPLLYIYISSFVFKFCIYHRLFLYYIFVYNVLKIVDYYIVFPHSDKVIIGIDLGVAGLFVFMLLYLKIKICRD